MAGSWGREQGGLGGSHTVRSLMSLPLKMMYSKVSSRGGMGRSVGRSSVPKERTEGDSFSSEACHMTHSGQSVLACEHTADDITSCHQLVSVKLSAADVQTSSELCPRNRTLTRCPRITGYPGTP